MDQFDPESGLVYRETVVKESSRPIVPWGHRCANRTPVPIRSPNGTLSLYETAIRKILRNITALSSETLQLVPNTIVQKLWRASRREGRESFNVWRTFANSGHGERQFGHSIEKHKIDGPLVDFFTSISSPNFLWTVDLTLLDVDYSAADLKRLAVLTSLQNLHILYSTNTAGRGRFNDGVLENLSHAAATQCAFPRLEMISLLDVCNITPKSFKCLKNFPSLELFLPYNTRIGPKHISIAKEHGWRIDEESSFATFLAAKAQKQAYTREAYTANITFEELMLDYVNTRRMEKASASNNVPVLSTLLGGDAGRKARKTFQFDHVMCFERMQDLGFGSESERALPAAVIQSGEPRVGLADFLPQKRRKVRDGKAVALHTILGEL